jgi:D-glycero-D-manno-heptose 1,7-bisphosphate phosphatase
MPERAIFLDRDNTIIEDPDGYLGDPAKVKLLPGAATAIASMGRMGYRIIVASNQSGVARGMFTEEDVQAVNDEMSRQLKEFGGASIDASYYCPFHPEATVSQFKMDHEWRKPKPGMLLQAAEDFSLDLGQSWMIGDMPRDIAAGAAAGCRTILIRDPDHPAPDNESNSLPVSPNFIVKSLADAARIILREGRNPHPDLVIKPLPLPAARPAAPAVPAPEAVTPTIVKAAPPAVPTETQSESQPESPKQSPEPAAPASPATPSGVTVQIDEQALADRLARVIAQVSTPAASKPDSALRPVLDEILAQLRQQSRQQDMADFSPARMVAIIAQVAVAICLLMATWDVVGFSPGDFKSDQAYYYLLVALIRAGLWLLGGVILQGFVLALLTGSRRSRQ